MTIRMSGFLLMGAAIAAITSAAQADETVFDISQHLPTADHIAIAGDHILLANSQKEGCTFTFPPAKNTCDTITTDVRAFARYGDAWHESQLVANLVQSHQTIMLDPPSATSPIPQVAMQGRWALIFTQSGATVYFFDEKKQQWLPQTTINPDKNRLIASAAIDRTGSVWVIDDSDAGAVQIFRRNKKGAWVACQRFALNGKDGDYKFTGPIKFDGNSAFVRGESRTQLLDVWGPSTSYGIPLKEKLSALWVFTTDNDNNRWRATQRIEYPVGEGTKSLVWNFDAGDGTLVLTGFRNVDPLIGSPEKYQGIESGSFGVQRFVRESRSGKWKFDAPIGNYAIGYEDPINTLTPGDGAHLDAHIFSANRVLVHGDHDGAFIFPIRKNMSGEWQQLRPVNYGYAGEDDNGGFIRTGIVAASHGAALIAQPYGGAEVTLALNDFKIRSVGGALTFTQRLIDGPNDRCGAGNDGYIYAFGLANPYAQAVMGVKVLFAAPSGTTAQPYDTFWGDFWQGNQFHVGYIWPHNNRVGGTFSTIPTVLACVPQGQTPNVNFDVLGKISTAP